MKSKNPLSLQVDFHLNSSEGLTGWGSENEFSTAELLAAFFEYFAKVRVITWCGSRVGGLH